MSVKAITLCFAMSALMVTQAPSHVSAATLDGGVCYLNVTVNFSGGSMVSATSSLASPSYTMTVSGAIDLAAGTSGAQACVYNLGSLEALKSTSVTATPTTAGDLWTCEAALGFGEWTQSWSPSPPALRWGLNYTITGTWGHWTMLIIDNNQVPSTFYSVIELTLRDPTTAANCAQFGVDPLHLTGVQVFQDP